jgi:uncharacterized cupin superfamily protein
MSEKAKIVPTADLEWKELKHGERFHMRIQRLGVTAGGQKLGCSLYEIPAGKRAWPYHFHRANEEAVYVLEGEGSIRLPDGDKPIRAGDYISLPVNEEGAHQIVNTSGAPLRFLCMSTMIEPEIAVYPDSGKIGYFTGVAPGADRAAPAAIGFFPAAAQVGYFEGEE